MGLSYQNQAWEIIGAALGVAHDACVSSYSGLQLPVPIFPIVMSTGGTLTAQSFKMIKELIPNKQDRRSLSIDISVSLVRSRASLYYLD